MGSQGRKDLHLARAVIISKYKLNYNLFDNSKDTMAMKLFLA